MQFHGKFFGKTGTERFRLFRQQIEQLVLFAHFQTVSTVSPLAHLDPVGKQRIVRDIETVHRATPRESRVFHRIALVERHRLLAIGPGEIGIMRLADIDCHILFGAREILAFGHQLFKQRNIDRNLIDRFVAQIIVKRGFAQRLQIFRRNWHLSLLI